MEINNNQKKDKELNRVLFQNVNRKEKKKLPTKLTKWQVWAKLLGTEIKRVTERYPWN